jgi:hypothetical protein
LLKKNVEWKKCKYLPLCLELKESVRLCFWSWICLVFCNATFSTYLQKILVLRWTSSFFRFASESTCHNFGSHCCVSCPSSSYRYDTFMEEMRQLFATS